MSYQNAPHNALAPHEAIAQQVLDPETICLHTLANAQTLERLYPALYQSRQFNTALQALLDDLLLMVQWFNPTASTDGVTDWIKALTLATDHVTQLRYHQPERYEAMKAEMAVQFVLFDLSYAFPVGLCPDFNPLPFPTELRTLLLQRRPRLHVA